MKPRICICCGEPMAQGGHALSRDANLCASCSSITDGMLEDSAPDAAQCVEPQLRPPLATNNEILGVQSTLRPSEKSIAVETPSAGEEIVVEWKAGRLRKRE